MLLRSLAVLCFLAFIIESEAELKLPDLAPAEQAEVDAMVGHLLTWIQELYQTRNSRQARQFLPGRPEKPRPFEAATYLPPVGYPSKPKPMPSYNEGPPKLPFQPTTLQPAYGTTDSDLDSTEQTRPQPNQPQRPTQGTFTDNPNQGGSNNKPQTQRPTYTSQTSFTNQPTYTDNTIPDTQTTIQPGFTDIPGINKPDGGQEIDNSASTNTPTDDDRHPPHIHDITVDCGKEMMTINIEFNKPYNGIIYSQDHFNQPECVYVREGSNQLKFSFTVSLNNCGTRFFSDFENEGQAYLENVLVLQNEPGIQEVWDHIRRVRCLWEGNLTKQLMSSLSVGMLNQITSNFSGDTAMARLDIQTGKGPFAPEANGLVKIGETMTLVVSVTGDAGFDILVRECIARDATGEHQVALTDHDGCVLKPKLFGTFQKTRDTGNTGASIIAFAYFNAFKFPDEMDLVIQCDVELCKTDCEVCPTPGSVDPARRRRRDLTYMGNRTEPTTVGKSFRVVFPEDLPVETGYCLSPAVAMAGATLIVISALLSSFVVSCVWKRATHADKVSF